ncbi:helix-turn-helix domain-containing protein [Micromonospora eburnea]|uniref:Tetratricopeptide repeat-containing protein n=1 Tax=Micromonospora eburnea TaxID=227316 RepID=A0A1C6VNL2_9ACTN|nr:helix-turn-helix domain-containing protein [Micromonospora eburnea]SCL67891.1 Tetratricopeptide repeat-containing protein [Micromonospora eburnea]
MHVVATWTGQTAKALRLALRMTFDDFAAHLGVSTRGVTKWEAQPDVELAMRTQQLLDVALKRADDDARARFGQFVQEPATPTTAREEPAIPAPLPASVNLPRRVTPDLLRFLRRALRDHYTADNLLGPRVLLPAITAHADTIEQLARDASGQSLDDLLQVGAGYAEFAGWLHQDAGDAEAATAWYRRALEWAEASQDDRMAAFVLTRRAVQAIGVRNGAHAARLANAAQRDRGAETIRIRAIAAQTEALGHAVHGVGSEADRALDVAEMLLDDGGAASPAEGDPSDGRYCDLRLYLKISRAKCHLELGRASAAVSAFTAVLDNLPPDYHRDRGQYLSRLAQAYVLAGSPEEACACAEESFAIAVTTGSSRTLNDLRNLLGQLRPWASSQAVVKLRGLLATAV